MEKPEWFEEVDAFESKPLVGETRSAHSGVPRMAKRLVVIGASAVFAAGGVAFAASTFTGTANAVTSTPTPASSPAATPDPTTSPTATATPSPAVGGTGIQPTIAGVGSGDDQEQGDNNQAGDDGQVSDDSNSVDVNAQIGVNQDGSGDD